MALKMYNSENVKNYGQFKAACRAVSTGISARNAQLQELMVLAVNEAAKLTEGGKISNNLTWLSEILIMAEETKGINVKKVSQYIVKYLCTDSVVWKDKTKSLGKKKDIALEYNVTPAVTWMDYGKPETVAKALDYGKNVTKAIEKALDDTKGGLTVAEVLKAVLDAGLSATDITNAFEVLEDEAIDEMADIEYAEEVAH